MNRSIVETVVFDKVAVFVLRSAGGGLELLTFLHPLAGRQVPAGSVEHDEAPEAAARREVCEETGVDGLTGLVVIGEWIENLGRQSVALEEVVLTDFAKHQVDHVKRGHRVRIEATRGTQVLVQRLVYDFNTEPPIELPQPQGWAAAGLFGNSIRRSFFLAHTANDGRLAWVQHADNHAFSVEWQPLSRDLALIEGQAEWLAAHFERLVSHFP